MLHNVIFMPVYPDAKIRDSTKCFTLAKDLTFLGALCDWDEVQKCWLQALECRTFSKVFLVTATPVIHSGRYHFHFDADALFLGFCRLLRSFQLFDATASPYIGLLRFVMETAMHRNGLGSLLPFPLTPVSRQTGTRLVLPLSSSAGEMHVRC